MPVIIHKLTHIMTQAYESQTSLDNVISVKYELCQKKMEETMRREKRNAIQ